jgi:hypothetical protein
MREVFDKAPVGTRTLTILVGRHLRLLRCPISTLRSIHARSPEDKTRGRKNQDQPR